MKDKLTAIISGMTIAIIGGVCLNVPIVANAKTNTTKNFPTIAEPTSVELTSETTLLARTKCKVNQFETQVFQLTNQVRQRYGLRPLRWNCRLIAASKNHSVDMARTRKLSHTGSDGSTLSIRANRVGYEYSYLAENVAAGQRTPEQVVESWMNSSGHRRNILNPKITEIGVGYAYMEQDRYRTYWTQVFGSR
ncbi:MAG: CAP domain-containing protein [Xenococcaceae cyanobacterium MO_167.B27]|nr:CAP domain-containing protein [Xenococcaceae cyanobacterium MO_167.B27]